MAEEQRRSSDDRLNRVEIVLERVVTTMEFNQRREETIMEEIKKITDKLSLTDGLNKEFTTLVGDVRALRHDLKNHDQSLQAVPILSDKINDNAKDIASLGARTTNLETFKSEMAAWRSEELGKRGAYKQVAGWMQWLIQLTGGGIVVLLLSWLQSKYGVTISGE